MNEHMTHSIRDLIILTECVLDGTVLRPEHKTTTNNTTVPSQKLLCPDCTKHNSVCACLLCPNFFGMRNLTHTTASFPNNEFCYYLLIMLFQTPLLLFHPPKHDSQDPNKNNGMHPCAIFQISSDHNKGFYKRIQI